MDAEELKGFVDYLLADVNTRNDSRSTDSCKLEMVIFEGGDPVYRADVYEGIMERWDLEGVQHMLLPFGHELASSPREGYYTLSLDYLLEEYRKELKV